MYLWMIFLSCTWSHISEAIVTQRQQQPAGGKESAPAPNPWSGEKHSVRTQSFPPVQRVRCFIAASFSPCQFVFLFFCLPLCFLICVPKLQKDKLLQDAFVPEQICKCRLVFEMGQFPLWQEMCVYLLVLKTTPWAEMRNPNQPPPPSPPLINCLAWFTSCFLHAHSHLILCVSLCSLEVFFSYLLLLPWFFV